VRGITVREKGCLRISDDLRILKMDELIKIKRKGFCFTSQNK
jgi:hypothetical protein